MTDSGTLPGVTRCDWGEGSELLAAYHDTEWGVPVRDDRELFEHLALDSFQAGLSWAIVLRKRPAFRAAFDGFDPERVARYGPAKVEALLADAGIIRNRQKIEATIGNARAWLELQEDRGSFSGFLWEFVGGDPIVNQWRGRGEVPAISPESDAMSNALKGRGFKFVGSTICYAFMQATGLVNDHVVECFRHGEVLSARPNRDAHQPDVEDASR